MPILEGDLKYYLSGGGANADPDASLGGDRSSTEYAGSLFDDVSGDESADGHVDYRCIYFRNESANAEGLADPVLWLQAQPDESEVAVGIDPAGKNGTATTIADEEAAPAGVTFSAPSSKGSGIALPGAPYGENDEIAIWFRRTVDQGASAKASDAVEWRVEGDTVPDA